ncbi:hypothetical protein [Anatilimnocola floriformis]|uniref:hypothetical protein n=1 Tax=Anatilimnocola floriformis TaxID=2948575 RepID=UPI0020C2C5AF|nr:hypothetical protein [Anatilimnocola floriformis]
MSLRTLFGMFTLLLATAIVVTRSARSEEDKPQIAELELTANSKLIFADEKAGREILTADDDFSRRLSRFDLQSRLKSDREVTRDDWRKQIAEQVTAWPAEEKERIKKAVDSLRPKLAAFRLPLPKAVLLIRTTGQEEAEAAYTRANAIALPAAKLRHPQGALEALLAHELFHVMSRHDATVRAALYKIVGFSLGDEVQLPKSLDDRRITNPDAPKVDCYITLKNDNQEVTAVPLLYATPEQYVAKTGRQFFDYITFRLLVVDKVNGKWQPRMKDQQPVVLDPKKVEHFYDQVGKNTTYIWHPDEILADNFVHLVNKRQKLETPRVTEAMAEVLKP